MSVNFNLATTANKSTELVYAIIREAAECDEFVNGNYDADWQGGWEFLWSSNRYRICDRKAEMETTRQIYEKWICRSISNQHLGKISEWIYENVGVFAALQTLIYVPQMKKIVTDRDVLLCKRQLLWKNDKNGNLRRAKTNYLYERARRFASKKWGWTGFDKHFPELDRSYWFGNINQAWAVCHAVAQAEIDHAKMIRRVFKNSA